MEAQYLLSIFKEIVEIDVQTYIEDAYDNEELNIKNYHKYDRRHEDGIDILVIDNKQAIAVKKKPGKADIKQLKMLAGRTDINKKIYIYFQPPTAPFEAEILKYHDAVEFWDWKKLHDFLTLKGSKKYIVDSFRSHPLTNSLFNILKLLLDNKDIVPLNSLSVTKGIADFMWQFKDDSVKLKSILNYVKNRWSQELNVKTEKNPQEYLGYLDLIHKDLNLVNSIGCIPLSASFDRMKREFPYLLSLYWNCVYPRSSWKDFIGSAINASLNDDLSRYIKSSWVLPDMANGHYKFVPKGFYSTLNYLLDNFYNIAKSIEDGVDWLYEKYMIPSLKLKSNPRKS